MMITDYTAKARRLIAKSRGTDNTAERESIDAKIRDWYERGIIDDSDYTVRNHIIRLNEDIAARIANSQA